MITRISILDIIQKNLDLPEDVLNKLVDELYQNIADKVTISEDSEGLSVKDLEDLLTAVKRLKEIHSTIVPKYTEDVLYENQLSQLEEKISKLLFNTT